MNYFNYFTEVEEHFQRKRGAQIWLSPLDWALIGSWREAGIPLAAVLAGIDQAFEKFERGKRRDTQRPRSLVYCAPAVMEAAEAAAAAAAGAGNETPPPPSEADDSFSAGRIATHLEAADAAIAACPLLDSTAPVVAEVRATLQRLLEALTPTPGQPAAPASAPEIDRILTVVDDKLQAALLQAVPVESMADIRAGIERELAPYRRKLRVEQLAMIERQFLQRKLLEHARLPRLSLFYMT